jgi:multidrug resistance efflux pump
VKRWRTILGVSVILLGVAFIGVVMASSRTKSAVADGDIPVVAVKVGDLDLKIHSTGELRASHSMMLSAPQVGGGALQITHLLPSGTPVKKGQIVLEFDPSEQQYKLEQSRSELEQAEQEITKAKSDAAVQGAQDKVALLKARFDVRRAELEVSKNELVSSIDAKKNDLALDQAKRALAQLEQDIKSHAASGQATIALAQEKSNKSRLEMKQAQQNIEKMHVAAPMDGVLAIEKNVDSTGGMFWGGMSLPDYREGDQVRPGNAIARVIDPSNMDMVAKADERERGNIRAGQTAEIQFDALPGQVFDGTVKTVAGMAMKNFWDDQVGGSFEVTLQLPNSDPRLRAGLTAQVVILGDQKKGIAYIPRQSVFLKEGKRVAYIKNGSSFEARELKILAESESRVAVDGLKPGAEVALLDPAAAPKKQAEGASAGPSLSGGGK